MSGVVVVRLLGGLGNQLFQWAAGSAVAEDAGAALRIDPSLLAPTIPARLGELGLDAPRWAPTGAVAVLARVPGLWRICRATGWKPRLGRTRFVFDRLRGHDGTLASSLPANGTLVLTGYWQSPAWAARRGGAIREALPPIESDAVALHVRRGDYASIASTAAYHGVLDGSYYRRALEFLGEDALRRPVVVYTDEPDRVRAEGWLPREATFAPPAPDVEHLRRMAGSAHLVTANSSFSWWAGWLGERAGRRVIAPARWWTDRAAPTPHPAPPHWVRLESISTPIR